MPSQAIRSLLGSDVSSLFDQRRFDLRQSQLWRARTYAYIGAQNPYLTFFADICSVLGVTAYPSFVFFGFGSLGRQKSSRVPQCASEFPLDVIDYDAVMDWISLLSWLSRFNRMSDYFRNFFTSRSVASHFANDQNTERDATIATLTAEVRRLNAELDRRKALDLFDSLPNHGDPYPLLNALTIDETASLRGCVTDMMRDYCSFETDEKHCDEIRGNDCLSTNLTHEVWQQSTSLTTNHICPLRRSRGCAVLSTCMQPHVLTYYKNSLQWGACRRNIEILPVEWMKFSPHVSKPHCHALLFQGVVQLSCYFEKRNKMYRLCCGLAELKIKQVKYNT